MWKLSNDNIAPLTYERLLAVVIDLYKQQDVYKNGFGIGFWRWVRTCDIDHIFGWTFAKTRRECDKLVKAGLFERKSRPGCYVQYSLKEYEGYKIMHDYFIENK